MSKNLVDLNDSGFDDFVKDGVVLVDFWAPWCGPCRVVGPIVEGLAAEFDGAARVAKVNVDENQRTAMQFRVMSIPTVLVFSDGEVVETLVGAQAAEVYREALVRHV